MQVDRLLACCLLSTLTSLTNPTALTQSHEITIMLSHGVQRSKKRLTLC